MKSVYCAVRTGSLNKAVCPSSLKGYLHTHRRDNLMFTLSNFLKILQHTITCIWVKSDSIILPSFPSQSDLF